MLSDERVAKIDTSFGLYGASRGSDSIYNIYTE